MLCSISNTQPSYWVVEMAIAASTVGGVNGRNTGLPAASCLITPFRRGISAKRISFDVALGTETETTPLGERRSAQHGAGDGRLAAEELGGVHGLAALELDALEGEGTFARRHGQLG